MVHGSYKTMKFHRISIKNCLRRLHFKITSARCNASAVCFTSEVLFPLRAIFFTFFLVYLDTLILKNFTVMIVVYNPLFGFNVQFLKLD